MKSKYFVPFETAKLLKKKGYNEECTSYYGDGIIRIGRPYTNKEFSDNTPNWLFNECISAPTYHEVVDWLEGKGIYVFTNYYDKWAGFIRIGRKLYDVNIYPTREEALNAAILKALEML